LVSPAGIRWAQAGVTISAEDRLVNETVGLDDNGPEVF
jgi:hypothetical protein